MAVTRVTYATREEVKAAMDVKLAARNDLQVDRAVESATDTVEGLLHRRFFPQLGTRYFDWPNYQYAYPWRLWMEDMELADGANTATLTSGGVPIPNSTVFYEPVNQGPPYDYIELNRASTSAFGVSDTPQHDIAVTGWFGYWLRTTPAGTLAVAMTDTTTGLCTVTNGAAVGVGDNILVDAERMLVQDRAMVDTGQAQVSGLTTPQSNDVALGVANGALFYVGETLLLGSERVLIVDIAGNVLTVIRAWQGTVLAAHAGAEIYAPRLLTVQRGSLGTTAAAHTLGALVNRALYPGLVKELTVAEALVEVRQQVGAYAASQGSGPSKQTNIGAGLPDLRARCYTAYGRQVRIGAV